MKKRARNREDKEERRQATLAAALEVWTTSTFDTLTMAEVARHAGLAKGTLYLYFSTKEALLLTLLENRLDQCLAGLEHDLANGGAVASPDSLADIITGALFRDRALVRLQVILGTILEHNLPPGRIRRFKAWILQRMGSAGAVLERWAPFLRRGEGLRVLLDVQMVVAGVGQLAHPAPAVARVLAQPGFESLRFDFESEFRGMLAALLRGRAGVGSG